MAQPSTKNDKPLKVWFNIIIRQSPLNIDSDFVKEMLERDFNINPNQLEENLLKILPEMVGHFINNWPGWNKSRDYCSGKITHHDWFKKFTSYMRIRINSFIEKGYKEAVNELKTEEPNDLTNANQKSYIDHSPQTDNLAVKGFAPFSLDISCSSEMINTLVFASNDKEDVIIQQHNSIPWCTLSFKSLINWPYVSVQFKTDEFSFTRTVCMKYQRYISLLNTTHQLLKSDFINNVSIVDKNQERKCFTYNYLEEFVTQYKSVLGKVREYNFLSNYDDICLLLDNFLLDVKEIDIKNSMATNTAVTFNIGKSIYTRNKKVKASKDTTSDVAYVEIITPRIELKLNKCDVVQDEEDTKISFQHLNQLSDLIDSNSDLISKKLPVVTFFCTFCNSVFNKKFSLMEHLYTCHQMEQCVLCSDCKVGYKVEQLTAVRWSHACKMNKMKNYN